MICVKLFCFHHIWVFPQETRHQLQQLNFHFLNGEVRALLSLSVGTIYRINMAVWNTHSDVLQKSLVRSALRSVKLKKSLSLVKRNPRSFLASRLFYFHPMDESTCQWRVVCFSLFLSFLFHFETTFPFVVCK